jgi:excisionase family DNA binding protein
VEVLQVAIQTVNFQEPIPLTVADTELVRESSHQLAELAKRRQKPTLKLLVQSEGNTEDSIEIPLPALHLLTDVLTQMAAGNPVTLMPAHAELTIGQAANILGVARVYLANLLEEGQIPCRGTGRDRRIYFDDLMVYKQTVDERRLIVLEELAREAQELDMGY